MGAKSIFLSKTFWVNLLALVAMVVQAFTAWVLPPEFQAMALTVVNFILRMMTKQPVEW